MKREKRTERVELQLTPSERAEITAASESEGFGSLAAFIRIAALILARGGLK